MMVLLILSILLGVALPTFVGARDRTADAAAFARLKAAADTAYALSDFGTDFTRATPGALDLAEPWLDYTSGSQPSSDPDVISVSSSLPTEWAAVVLSGSGQCFGVVLTANGRDYYESASCMGASTSAEWTGGPGYLAPAPTPSINGEATFVGAVPETTNFSPDQEYRSDDELFVFFESSQVLVSDLTVAGITIPAGTAVCSHIVWYDPSFTTNVSATIDFGAPILAGAGRTSELQATNQFAIAGVNYFNYNRPWYDSDSFSFSGAVGTFNARAINGNADMMRILTDCG